MAERGFVVAAVLWFSGFAIFLLIGNGEEASNAQSALARLSWYPVYLALLGGLLWRSGKIAGRFPALWPLWLLLGLTLLSCLTAYDPALTQRRAVALAATVLMGLYLAVRAPAERTVPLLAAVWTGLAAINFLVVLAAPGTGIDYELHIGAWKGINIEKNHLGGQMARAHLMCLAAASLLPRRRKLFLAGAALAFLLVLGSTSKTSLLCTVAAWIMLAAVWGGQRSPRAVALAGWALAVGGTAAGGVLLLAPELAVALIGKDLSFTGRTDIWAAALQAIESRPWTGFGQGAFWEDLRGPAFEMREALGWEVPTAHNGWLEVGLAMGWPGMAALLALYGTALWKSALLLAKGVPWPLLILVQIGLFSLSESVLWTQNAFVTLWFAFACCWALLGVPKQRRAAAPRLLGPGSVRRAPVRAAASTFPAPALRGRLRA